MTLGGGFGPKKNYSISVISAMWSGHVLYKPC